MADENIAKAFRKVKQDITGLGDSIAEIRREQDEIMKMLSQLRDSFNLSQISQKVEKARSSKRVVKKKKSSKGRK